MRLQNFIQLFLAAFIWGIAFVAQRVGMDHVGPLTFNAVRSILGGLVLIPVIYFFRWREAKNPPPKSSEKGQDLKTLLAGGIACGLVLCLASNLQQMGIQYTTVGKAGFLTACYIILVPILGGFLGKRTGKLVWLAVALSVAGLYLLCMTKERFSIQRGDALVLCCSVLFAIHILVIDYFSPRTDGVKLSCIQFFTCGVLSLLGAFLFEQPSLENIRKAWLPIGYAGIFSCGIAYTLQILGQKDVNPTVASLILSLESCVSVLAGWVLLGQSLSGRELMGCGVMFVAIILAQLPGKGE